MNRNQKIALGCGGAGCLGLIVVAIACVLIYFFAYRAAPYRDSNFNTSTNRNSNTNDNSDITTNTNDNDNSSNSSASPASSMSDDEKHRLYHAAYITTDAELIRRVSVKLGLMNDDFTIGEEYAGFLVAHASWTISNRDFIETISSPEKARAYVNEHFPN